MLHRLLIILVLSYGCSTANESKKIDSNPDVQDTAYYSSSSNYSLADKLHYESFIEKFGEKIIQSGPKDLNSIEKLKERYRHREFNKERFPEWISISFNIFNANVKGVITSGPFDFQYVDNGKNKTLVYIHDNVSSPAYVWDFANDLREEFSDYNFVFVNQIRVNRNKQSFKTEELEEYFESGMSKLKDTFKTQPTKLYLNVICHAQIYTYKYLKDSNDFEKVVYYAPMVKKSSTDRVLDFEKIFEGVDVIDFQSVLYVFNLGEYGYASGLMIPKAHNYYNLQTEIDLLKRYKAGSDLSKVKNKYLIYPEHQGILNTEAYGINFFSKNSITELKSFKHVDFYANSEKKMQYIKTLKKIMDKN